jgi:hypothetical protein
LVNTEK